MARRRHKRGTQTTSTSGLGPTPSGRTGTLVNPTLGIPDQGLGNLPSGPSTPPKPGAGGAGGGAGGGVGGPPPDPALEAQRAQANMAISLGGAWDAYQTGEINADYGFNAAGGIDPNNPYSRASLLQQNYLNAKTGTQNSYAAAGQLYSGAMGRAQSSNDRNYDIGIDQLKKSQAKERDAVIKGAVDRYSQYGLGVDDAALQSLMRYFNPGG